MQAGHQGLCHPAASAAELFIFGPPKPSCINCELLHGGFTRDLGLLHTEIPSQCGATRSCGGVLSEAQLQARHRGSSGLKFKSCVKSSQADCKQVNISSLKGLCSPTTTGSFSPGAGAQELLEKAGMGG